MLMTPVISAYASSADHAVGLVYHHVSTSTPASTSVSPRQFDAHLAFLERQNFNVWTLGRILQALSNGEAVPDNTVAITFDDASTSVYTEVFPRMQKLGWPFPVFVSTEPVERGYGNTMSWQQLKEIAEAGNEIGNHSHTHAHLIRREKDETATEWRDRVTSDIDRAQALIESNLDISPKLFAYPYGEHSSELKAVVDEMGLMGVAQQSGAIGSQSDFLAVPRFPLATRSANISRLVISVRSRPLPVIAVEMPNTEDYDAEPPWLTLTLDDTKNRFAQLACFSSRGARLEIGEIPGDGLLVEVDLTGQTRPGRNKVNCTAPVAEEEHAFYWFSHLWMKKRIDGSWYSE